MSSHHRLSLCLSVIALVAFPLVAQAQLEVSTEVVQQLSGVESVTTLGDAVLVTGDVSELTLQPTGKITIKSESANVEVDVEDKDRRRVATDRVEGAEGEIIYLIRESGQFWIDVTAIDFEKNIYKRETGIVIDIPIATPVGPAMPEIEPPSESLQALVKPLGEMLKDSPEKAMAISSMFRGFAAGVRIALPSTAEKLWKVHGSAFDLIGLPPGERVGPEVDASFLKHVGFELKAGSPIDRPLNSEDQRKVAEIYDAIAWGVMQR